MSNLSSLCPKNFSLNGKNGSRILAGTHLALRHEELYSGIKDVVIRTDKIFEACEDVAILFRGITLVLCTLGTLSNPMLDECGLLDLIPMRSLVIDEASQIDVFEFMVTSTFLIPSD
jgi:hypothetical protein